MPGFFRRFSFGRGLVRNMGPAMVMVFALAPLRAASSSVEVDPTAYHLRRWTTDEGLPHNSANRIVQDHAGFLWFATVGGLARFDGQEFRPFRPPAEHRSLGLNIRGLAEERPGTLLVLTTGTSLLRLTGSTWSEHPVNALLATWSDRATDIHADAAGTLWIATAQNRIVRWSARGESKVFGPVAELASRSRRLTFALDAAAVMWICADTLLTIDENAGLVQSPLAAHGPRIVTAGRDGRIWLGANGRLLLLDRGQVVDEIAVPPESESGTIRHLFEDERGAVWIATTRQGLLRVAEGRTQRVPGLPLASFVTADREGNLWIGSDGSGVGQLREKSYQLANVASGLPHPTVSSVTEDAQGRVWLANRVGGLILMGANGRPQAGGLPAAAPFANVVCADAQNRLWFGGGRDGLLRWAPDGGGDPVALPVPAANLHLLFRARNGDMWFAADPGMLGYYRGDTRRVFSAAEGFPHQEIRTMAQDRDGIIWLGGRAGELLRWDGSRFERFDHARGFPREPIHAIHPDAAGHLWVGTGGGLVLKDGDRFSVLTEEHGLLDDIIQQILEDDRGNLWIAARRGLFYLSALELLDVARGTRPRTESIRLGAGQGLVGLSPTPNYNPAAWKTTDGRLWFAAAQGVVAIDPARVPHDLPLTPILIDEVKLDGRTLATDAPLRVPSGQHRVEFKFAALSYTAAESVLLRHRLEGADPDWVQTGTDRSASYAHLAPGSYRLHVIARNSAGRWNTDGAAVAFTVVPAWWETTAFLVVAVVLFTGGGAWVARNIAQRRLQQRLVRLEQAHALEKERNRIARDLHDDLGASLTELGLFADRLVASSPAEMPGQVSGLAWRTRQLSTELSGIVWTMSSRSATLQRLAEFIRQYAQRLFSGQPIKCIVRGGDTVPALPLAPDVQHQIIAAIREALNNVLKHSRATEVEVDLRFAAGIFAIGVADNGGGFDPAAMADADGNGLRNIRARAAETGGTATIDSAPGAGTRITLSIPVGTSA